MKHMSSAVMLNYRLKFNYFHYCIEVFGNPNTLQVVCQVKVHQFIYAHSGNYTPSDKGLHGISALYVVCMCVAAYC